MSLQTSPPGPRVPARSRALLQRAIEILVSVLFLALALRSVQFSELQTALRSANWGWIMAIVILTLFVLVLKGWRWQLLFYPEYWLPFGSVFTALCAGYLASNVLPGRPGEVVRAILLAAEQPVSLARIASTIIVERLLDVLTLLAVLVVLLPFIQLPPQMMGSARLLGVLALVMAATMVLLSFWKVSLLRLAHVVLGKIRFLDRPGVYAALEHLIDGFAALRTRNGLLLILISIVCWVAVVLMAWAAALAVHATVPWTGLSFAVVVTNLGMIIPSSPGYIGVFEGLAVQALQPFGIDPNTALAVALVWHAGNYLTLSAMGVGILMVRGVPLNRVLRWRNAPQSDSAAG